MGVAAYAWSGGEGSRGRSGGGWWVVMRETNGASGHFMVVARRGKEDG